MADKGHPLSSVTIFLIKLDAFGKRLLLPYRFRRFVEVEKESVGYLSCTIFLSVSDRRIFST
jgi:hypothetical protein